MTNTEIEPIKFCANSYKRIQSAICLPASAILYYKLLIKYIYTEDIFVLDYNFPAVYLF
jgi:hypothetical protein